MKEKGEYFCSRYGATANTIRFSCQGWDRGYVKKSIFAREGSVCHLCEAGNTGTGEHLRGVGTPVSRRKTTGIRSHPWAGGDPLGAYPARTVPGNTTRRRFATWGKRWWGKGWERFVGLGKYDLRPPPPRGGDHEGERIDTVSIVRFKRTAPVLHDHGSGSHERLLEDRDSS